MIEPLFCRQVETGRSLGERNGRPLPTPLQREVLVPPPVPVRWRDFADVAIAGLFIAIGVIDALGVWT